LYAGNSVKNCNPRTTKEKKGHLKIPRFLSQYYGEQEPPEKSIIMHKTKKSSQPYKYITKSKQLDNALLNRK